MSAYKEVQRSQPGLGRRGGNDMTEGQGGSAG